MNISNEVIAISMFRTQKEYQKLAFQTTYLTFEILPSFNFSKLKGAQKQK